MNIQIRPFHGPSDWGWIQQYIPMLRVEDTCGLMAIDLDKNETVGAFIVDNILYNSAQASFILKNSMVIKHGFIEECASFVFDGLGKDIIYGYVREDNTKAMRLNKRLGYKDKTRIPEGFGKDCDFIVMELHKDNCPFYKKLSEVA